MPSKRIGVLIILVVAGGIYGTSQVDWSRDVPYAPPNVPIGHVGYAQPVEMPGMPDQPGGGPVMRAPDQPGTVPAQPDKPARPDRPGGPAPSSTVELTPLNDPNALLIPESDTVRITVKPNGELRSAGFNLGSYSMVAERVKSFPGAIAVVMPHKDTPWKHVYWALQACKEGGAGILGLAIRRGGAPAMIRIFADSIPGDDDGDAGAPAVPEEMIDLPILLGTDAEGKVTYQVFDMKAKDLKAFVTAVSEYNGEYSDEFGGDYARNPITTPWVLKADPELPVSRVIRVMAEVRNRAVYVIRFGKDFPKRPK